MRCMVSSPTSLSRGKYFSRPGAAPFVAALALALVINSRAAAQYGQFDSTPVRHADEALIVTPPGFSKPGVLAIADDKTAATLTIRVSLSPKGKPTPCRITVVGPDGNFYQPKDHRLAPYHFGGHWPDKGQGNRAGKAPVRYFGGFFYAAEEVAVRVPPGRVSVEAQRGFEFHPARKTVDAKSGESATIELILDRADDLAKRGLWSGDSHLHFPRGTTEQDEAIFDLLDAEDVKFGGISCYNLDVERYVGVMDRLETPQRLGLGVPSHRRRGNVQLFSGQEYRSRVYGHLIHFGRKDLVLTGQTLDPNTWPMLGSLSQETIAAGGATIMAHGGYSQEIIADAIHGNVGAIELFQFGIYRGIGLAQWYHLRNAGYPLPMVGASDYPACRKLSDCRAYAHLDGEPTPEKWLKAISEGRSFATSGPLVLLEVAGRGPGERVLFDGAGKRSPLARVRVMSPAADVTRLELIANGAVRRRWPIDPEKARKEWVEFLEPIEIDRSTWFAARAYSLSKTGSADAEAHTNPIEVCLADQLPFDASSLPPLLKQIDQAIAFHEGRRFPDQAKVVAYFREAQKRLKDREATGAPFLGETTVEESVRPLPPRSPADALKTFEVAPGFHLELVADDRLVHDPVAGAFDADGRLYVAEMIDYPFHPPPGKPPLGRIRVLEDRDGDGAFDHSSVFAEGLLWPAGIACFKGGVYVAAAPDILYLKDEDGDGRADRREVVFTGFGIKNQQAMVNNLIWGLDGKIHGVSAHNGGEIRPGADTKAAGVSVRGADFRFDPWTRVFELESGTAQFGNTFDDAYNRFVCSESEPCYHVLLPRRYLARNPFLAAPSPFHDLSPLPRPVFRSSPIEGWRKIRTDRRMAAGERSKRSAGASHDVIDGGAGVCIYRGHAYPAAYRGDLFISDAQNNLIHHGKLPPSGVTFQLQRAEKNFEFVRSCDNWFRPVNLLNAPDGTLYALDMSREIIESIHIPTDVFNRLDLTRGRDQGRVYRIAPDGFRSPKPPRLSQANNEELIALLEHPSGWWRETAQRLLLERVDISTVPGVKNVLRKTASWQGRLHALATLKGLKSLADDDLARGFTDESPAVRAHTIQFAEERFNHGDVLLTAALKLAGDPAAPVRFQLAFSLGEAKAPRAVEGLAALASRDDTDTWTRTAILSSVHGRAGELAGLTARLSSPSSKALLEPLAIMVGQRNNQREVDGLIATITQTTGVDQGELLLFGLASGLRRAGAPLDPGNASNLAPLIENYRNRLADPRAAVASRMRAARLLGLISASAGLDPLVATLDGDIPEPLMLEVIAAILGTGAPNAASSVLNHWPRFSARVQERAAVELASRGDGAIALLDRLADGSIPSARVTPSVRHQLRTHPDARVRDRFAAVFRDQLASRAEALAKYKPAAKGNGDATKGQKVFERACAHCHQVRGKGVDVGPNLVTSRFRTAESILPHVIDPNLEAQPQYVAYTLALRDGRVLTGLLKSDNDASITLLSEHGKTHVVTKREIEEMASTGRSLMPEGVERDISVVEMTDLLAFLTAAHYDIGSEPGQGPPPDQH